MLPHASRCAASSQLQTSLPSRLPEALPPKLRAEALPSKLALQALPLKASKALSLDGQDPSSLPSGPRHSSLRQQRLTPSGTGGTRRSSRPADLRAARGPLKRTLKGVSGSNVRVRRTSAKDGPHSQDTPRVAGRSPRRGAALARALGLKKARAQDLHFGCRFKASSPQKPSTPRHEATSSWHFRKISPSSRALPQGALAPARQMG